MKQNKTSFLTQKSGRQDRKTNQTDGRFSFRRRKNRLEQESLLQIPEEEKQTLLEGDRQKRARIFHTGQLRAGICFFL